MRDNPTLFVDLYELTMAQVYFQKKMHKPAYFEVSVRRLPENWGFFVMAGLSEVASYLAEFRFAKEDIDFLHSTKIFSDDFRDCSIFTEFLSILLFAFGLFCCDAASLLSNLA